MKRKMAQKVSLDSNKLDQLNKNLENYKKLSPEVQKRVRREVIEQVNAQRNQFKQKLKGANAELKRLNLILGATGAGKSTLFNYLNGLPLIIKEGVGNNGARNQTIRLDVDMSKVPPGSLIAPIGHGFVSETTIPNFCKSRISDETYVDCAGEFDSRNILQSIINSYFKYQLAQKAEKVKLTIVINYSDIHTNRGAIFKQILKEVGNFIGIWDAFMESNSISLVITGVDLSIVKHPKLTIIQAIEDIVKDVKDLGLFKQILQNIAQREAVAIFAAPSRKTRKIINEDDESEDQLYIPQGERYNPSKRICTPEIISKTLDETAFMKNQDGLFLHNLQSNAQFIANAISEGIIEEIKAQVLSTIMLNVIDQNQSLRNNQADLSFQQMESEKEQLKEKISLLQEVQEIEQIFQIFNIKKKSLRKYESLRQDLNQFLKISNIPNISKKIIDVAKDISLRLRVKIEELDMKALQRCNIDRQKMEKQISVLMGEQRRQQMQRKHEKEKLNIQLSNQTRRMELQIQREQNFKKIDLEKLKAQAQLKKAQNDRLQQIEKRRIEEKNKDEQGRLNNFLATTAAKFLQITAMMVAAKLRKH